MAAQRAAAFMDGSLTRLLDPEDVLRRQIVSFVENGDTGFASGRKPDGGCEGVWWKEIIRPEEVTFDHPGAVSHASRKRHSPGPT